MSASDRDPVLRPGAPDPAGDRMLAALTASGVGVWSWDGATDESFWSDSMYALYGRERTDDRRRLRDLWRSSLHPEDRDRVLAVVDAAFASTATTYRHEFRIVRPDGTQRWIQGVARIDRDAAGRPACAYGTNVDITARKLAEHAQRASEEQLATMFDVTGVGMAHADPLTRRLLRVNAALCAMTGYAEEELLGMTVDDLNHPEDAARDDAQYRRLLEGGGRYEIEKRYRRKDGSALWVAVTVDVMRDAQGHPTRAFAVIGDISRHRLAEDALRRSEAQLVLVSNAVPVLISYVGADRRYRFCNLAYARWFGLPVEEIVGRRMRDVLGEPAWRAIEPHIDAALAGRMADFEAEVAYARGGTRWIHAVYTPDRDADGNVAGLVVMVADVTERRRAEEALREADRRKDEFLAMLAHELRNPLAPIRSGLALLRLPGTDAEARAKVTAMMERQVGHLVRLVDDLLEVSRITSGKIELRRETVDFAAVLRHAAETAAPLLAAAGVSLVAELPDAPVRLDADPVRLAQVVANLLGNAAKYTPAGGRVWLSAWREGSVAVASVRDTGSGIAADMLPRVFDLFAQAEGTRERAQGGLGIGLTLVQRLVRMHGGSVEARSEGPGRGAEFVVRLPLPERPAPDPATRPAAPDAAALPPLRVLVVDDNRDAATALAMLLEAVGDDVRVAHDGDAALATGAAFRPQVILLDIGLPRVDGCEVARQLRAHPWGAAALLVAVTGWGQEDDRRRSLEAGFDAHFVKPADPEGLLRLLEAVRRTPQAPRRAFAAP